MHYRLLAILLVLALSQCKTEDPEHSTLDPTSYTWGTASGTVIENGYFHSKKTLDTLGNQLVGDTLIPIKIEGSRMIIEKLVPLQMEMKILDGIEDFYITRIGYKKDTFNYEIKTIIGKTFLLLLSEHTSGHAYILKDGETILPETDNKVFPDYELGGYAVGDKIIRDDIEVLSKDQFGAILTEEAILMDNENIYLKVIGSSYIEEIRWLNIDDEKAEKLRKEINSKFKEAPAIEHFTDDTGNETELISGYYWSENEVNILLSRTTEFGELDKSWTLTYTNLIVSNILSNYIDADSENI